MTIHILARLQQKHRCQITLNFRFYSTIIANRKSIQPYTI